MTRTPQLPARALTADELAALDRDGVICVRGALDADWTARLARALDDAARSPTLIGRAMSRPKQGLYHDMFVWRRSDDLRDLWYESPLAHYAAQAMRSERVNLFYDEVFYKSAASTLPVPWHHDVTAFPLRGQQLMNVWVSVDPSTPASGGLEFVRGSHLWQRKFKVETAERSAYLLEADLEWCPDIEAERDRYDIVSWELEPGDALVFGLHVLHGSGPNRSHERPRRAVVFRFAGEDARYAPTPNTMPLMFRHHVAPGHALGGPLFPQLLPHGIAAERRPRDEGRLHFDLSVMARSMIQQLGVECRRRLRPSRFKPRRSEASI
jgi:ectoine hydroxylase-related dioxygenase (phytanoyl-CoA dioxygenase family)